MKVCEIYTSIQGESSYAGMPCTFIRMTGCNLRCAYCDTAYAYFEGTYLAEEDILKKVRDAGVQLVEITGGEPLLQQGVFHLITRIVEEGFAVMLETNGSQDIKDINREAIIILDIKTPGSGMDGEMNFSNMEMLKPNDEVKFVITSREDYVWSKEIIERYRLNEKCRLLFSPAYRILDPEDLAQWILGDRLRVRLNLQLHKYIFHGTRRGV
jgi:7-carboxy-7-deazaguanine synthase